jgi:hypothetical protein
VANARDEGRGVTITPEISQDPPLTSTVSPSHFPIYFFNLYLLYSTFFSLQHRPHAAALNHHLGGFGPEYASDAGFQKSLLGCNRGKPGFGVRATSPRSVIVTSVYAMPTRVRYDVPEEWGCHQKEEQRKIKKSFWLRKVKEERERSSGIGCRVSCDAF